MDRIDSKSNNCNCHPETCCCNYHFSESLEKKEKKKHKKKKKNKKSLK